MLVVIDGYNFIFAVNDLEKYVKINNIEDARERCISLLKRYKATKKYEIVIVFDSSIDYCVEPIRTQVAGLEIIYARYSKDADTAIKNMIDNCKHPRDTCVVTNDNDIKMHVKRKGSRLLSPENFYRDILKAIRNNEVLSTNEPISKIKGPTKEESQYWLNIFKNEVEDKSVIPQEEVLPKEPVIVPNKSSLEEPMSKYLGPSSDETDYWLKFFSEDQKENE